jgi:hypothetical protein
MSKYKFGDTFIKDNKAYIVLDCKDKTYYLQTRGGTLVTRSKDELNDLIQRLEYTFYPGLCDPKFITANDFHIGDMIIGRQSGKEDWYNHKKRVGIVIGKSVKRPSWFSNKKRYFIKIMWSDNSEIESINFGYIDKFFNKYNCDTTFHKFCWKLVPVVK